MARQDTAKKIYEWYEVIKEDTLTWRMERDRCKKVYFGNQWESSVATRLRERGQIDVVINVIRTLIRNRVSSMIAQKPTGKVYGMNSKDVETAIALEDFLDWHWYNSSGQIRAERVVMGAQREGVAYFIVYEDPKADFGRGELKIGDLTYRNVWIPKTAGKEWDFSDSPYIIVSKLITDTEFYRLNPGHKGKLTNDYFCTNDEIYWSGQKEHAEKDQIDFPQDTQEQLFIREFDTYEKFYKDTRIIYHIPTGTIQIIADDYTLTDGENDLVGQGIIKELTTTVPRVKYTKTYGDKIFKYSETLPISNYPVVPIVDEDTGNACPLGEIDHNFGVQELANKAWSMIVLNASLASNMKMVLDPAAMMGKDIKDLREDWAAPGAMISMPINKATGKFPFEIIKSEPLNQAFYTIFERLAQQIQFGTATFQSKLGDTSQAPDTYSATLQYGEWQKDNLRIPLSRLEMGIQRIFETILEWSPYYYDYPKYFEVVGSDGEPKMQFVNQPSPKGTQHDISQIKAKFRIRMGSTMPSQNVAHMNFYKELAQMNPLFLKYLVEYLPVKEKAKLIKELDLVQQLSAQLKQKEQEKNYFAGLAQNAIRQQAEMEIRSDVDKTKNKLDKILGEQQLVLKETKSKKKQGDKKK